MTIPTDDSAESIAVRLRRVREVLGLDKKTFAERAGMGQQTYGPFENAGRAISLEAAKKLRATYGISLEYIYFGKIEDLPHRIATQL
jgi:transcriptional regulator with XRE-family HTH domain